MSFRPLIFLGGSCAIALAMALLTLSSGAGLLAAFMVYSFGGSATLVALSLVSFLKFDDPVSQLSTSKSSSVGWASGI